VNGNFDRVNLQGHDKIKVEGWLDWDEGDEHAQLSIAVSQNGATALGSTTVTNGETDWNVVIDVAEDAFSKGFASGQAAAVVTAISGSSSQGWVSGPIRVN
jgi:hypothetical protein